MTDDTSGPRLPTLSRVKAEDVIKEIFDFEPGNQGWGRRKATTPPVKQFKTKYIVGVLDLRAVEFPHLLEFVDCRFEHPPDLRQTKLAGCEFVRCHLPGLDARNLYSDNDVRLVDSIVEGKVDLTDGEISGTLELSRSVLRNVGEHALHADRLQLAGALLAVNMEARGQVRIPGLRTGGNVSLAGAILDCPESYALDANGIHVGGNLHCVSSKGSNGRRFQANGRLFMPSARIESDFSLRGALLKPADVDFHDGGNQRFFDPRATLIADRIQVSGNVYLDQNLVSTGTLRLVNSRIGGSVRLTSATIDLSSEQETFEEDLAKDSPGPYPYRALHMDGAEIAGGIDARNSRIAGQLRLVDVNARGSVLFDGSVLSNRNGDVVEGRRFTTGGNLDARGVKVFGSILLPECNIGANLDLRASRLVNPGTYHRDGQPKPSLDLRVALIGRDLVCAKGERKDENGDEVDVPFSAHSEIRIRRAEIGRQTNFQGAQLGSSLKATAINGFGLITQELRVRVAVAPKGKISLRHARCASLADNAKFWDASGNIDLDDFRYDSLSDPIKLDDDAQVKKRIRLLRTAMGDYRPGPYDQFAAMLRASGNEEHASTVLVAKQSARYRALADGSWWAVRPFVWFWSFLQRRVVGYGYRPMLALLWLFPIYLLGWWYFSAQPPPDEANADDNLVWAPWLYTIDHLVPIVDFGHKNRWHFEGWAQGISAALITAGWILATTVATGLARMLRRNN